MPNTSIYNNGASFQNENNTPGKLYVTDRSMVSNLNAELFQNKEPADFLCIDKSSSATYGIKQSGKTITMTGETINLDNSSEIRIGNLVIKSADGGNGILIGRV